MPNFIEILPVEAELFHAYRQMDRRTHGIANRSFSQFSEPPEDNSQVHIPENFIAPKVLTDFRVVW